jgi:hypothetical protein
MGKMEKEETEKTAIVDQPRQKVSKTPRLPISQARWHAPVIAAVQQPASRSMVVQGQPPPQTKT